MVGMMLWEPSGHWTRPVTLKEVSVLHIRFLCARMAQDRRRNPLTERRRLRTAGKKLLRQRVEQVVLPAGASAEALPEGLRPVETLSLRRAIAADWCGELLRFRGENPAGARVLITADALSGEVVRTVTELALRHRYLLMEVPYGGEELCRRLRREYGVSLLLHPGAGETADIQLAFDVAERRGESFLPLYDETFPMPHLTLPPEIEARLPEQANRGQLLSALWETGVLRPGQVSVQLKSAADPAEPA